MYGVHLPQMIQYFWMVFFFVCFLNKELMLESDNKYIFYYFNFCDRLEMTKLIPGMCNVAIVYVCSTNYLYST